MSHAIHALTISLLIISHLPTHAQLVAESTILNPTEEIHYWQYRPDNYATDTTTQFPLVVFLHGGGEVGTDLELVKKHGLPKLIAEGQSFPFVLVAPQNPRDQLWDDALVLAVLDRAMATHRIDPDRVYLTGMSRGGFGTWRLAIQNPERFAAIAPVCGGGVPDYAQRLKDVPVWAFHGAKDRVIPLSRTVAMVEALLAAGGNVKLTVYPEAGHDAWTETYENPELYTWLLGHTRAK
ncbi:MAG: prolyl oligopeptidase family serine peptidase [Tunicatimonas sp.]